MSDKKVIPQYAFNKDGVLDTGIKSVVSEKVKADVSLYVNKEGFAVSVKEAGHETFLDFHKGNLTNAQFDGAVDVAANLNAKERAAILGVFKGIKAHGGATDADLAKLGELVVTSVMTSDAPYKKPTMAK